MCRLQLFSTIIKDDHICARRAWICDIYSDQRPKSLFGHNVLKKYFIDISILWYTHTHTLYWQRNRLTSKTTVAQKCSAVMEIRKYHLRTNGRTDRQTWVGARDACASKKAWEMGMLNSKLKQMEILPLLDESEQKNKRGGNPPHSEHTTPSSENIKWSNART